VAAVAEVEGGAVAEQQESEAERGQRIAAQWTTNAEAAGEGAAVAAAGATESEEERGKRIAAQWTTNVSLISCGISCGLRHTHGMCAALCTALRF
jgi:hypothetical protein